MHYPRGFLHVCACARKSSSFPLSLTESKLKIKLSDFFKKKAPRVLFSKGLEYDKANVVLSVRALVKRAFLTAVVKVAILASEGKIKSPYLFIFLVLLHILES